MTYCSCAIRFKDDRQSEPVQVYRHTGGQPEYIVSFLDYLRTVLKTTGSYRNPSFTAAQFIFLDKLWKLCVACRTPTAITNELMSYFPDIDENHWETLDPPEYLLGHGVGSASTFRGDEEYLYEVTLYEDSDWTIRVAGIGESFHDDQDLSESAEWLFEGELNLAVDNYT